MPKACVFPFSFVKLKQLVDPVHPFVVPLAASSAQVSQQFAETVSGMGSGQFLQGLYQLEVVSAASVIELGTSQPGQLAGPGNT